MDDNNLNRRFEEQNMILKNILKQSQKTGRYLLWLKVLNILKILIIIAPIVLAIIYLPPFIKRAINKYQDVLPGLEGAWERLSGSQISESLEK